MADAATQIRPTREQAAGARLPYARHIDDATIETRDGRLLQVLHLKGFPFETADTEELNYRKTVRETMLRGVANSRFALYHHIVRREAQPNIAGEVPGDGFAHDLDAAWRARLGTRKLYVNELFLTLVRRPLGGRVGILEDLFRVARGAGDSQEAAAGLAQEMSALNAARDGLLSALAPYGARLLTAYSGPQGDCSEPLEFFSLLFNGELRPVRLPDADLGLYLPYRRVSFGARAIEFGAAGRLERSFAGMVSVKDYPGQTAPGVLDDLMRLPVEMVLTESFGFVDRQQTLDRMNLALRRMRAADDEAMSLRRDLGVAKDDVAAGRSSFGEHHLTVMVKAPTPDRGRPGGGGRAVGVHRAGRHRRARRHQPGSGVLGAVPRQLQGYRPPRADLVGQFRGAGQLPQFSGRSGRGQPLGSGDHRAGDDLGRAVLLQLPSRRSGQLHRHRPLGIGQDRGAGLPAGSGPKGAPAHGVLRQGSRRGDLPARHRREL